MSAGIRSLSANKRCFASRLKLTFYSRLKKWRVGMELLLQLTTVYFKCKLVTGLHVGKAEKEIIAATWKCTLTSWKGKHGSGCHTADGRQEALALGLCYLSPQSHQCLFIRGDHLPNKAMTCQARLLLGRGRSSQKHLGLVKCTSYWVRVRVNLLPQNLGIFST